MKRVGSNISLTQSDIGAAGLSPGQIRRLKKKANKQAETIRSTNKLSQTVIDVIDQVASGRSASSDCLCNESQGSLEEKVSTLSLTVERQQHEIADLKAQIEFMLSALGWSSLPSSTGSTDQSEPTNPTPGQTDTSDFQPAAVHSDRLWSEVARRPARAQQRLRDAIVAAVYNDQQRQNSRATNLVVSGLPPSTSVNDTSSFTDLIRNEMGLIIDIAGCKRLGRPVMGKIQPLLVHFKSVGHADQVMALAKRLRQSTNEMVRKTIFINRHLTPAQSRAAYEDRCRRRQTQLRKNTSSRDEACRVNQGSEDNDPNRVDRASTNIQQHRCLNADAPVYCPPPTSLPMSSLSSSTTSTATGSTPC